jgi:hypothetical protein
MLTPEERGVLGLISGARARENVATLVSPSERVPASSMERAGAEKILHIFSSLMDKIELEAVPGAAYLRGYSRLEVRSPKSFPIIPAHINAVSGSGSGSGPLVFVGDGDASSYERLDNSIRGSVILVSAGSKMNGDNGRLVPVAREALANGAACLIYYFEDSNHPSVHDVDTDLPVFSVGRDRAEQLLDLLNEFGEVEIGFSSEITEQEGSITNVGGTIIGFEKPDEIIYVTSHLDTFFEGANDNNASTAVLLELAHVLNVKRPRRTFRFVVFGGEEGGAKRGSRDIRHDRGSVGHSELHRTLLQGTDHEAVVAIINGEILGYSPHTPILATPEFIPFAWQVVHDLGTARRVLSPLEGRWMGSDHLAFHTLGVPSIYMIPQRQLGSAEAYWDYYHTPIDNLELVTADALEANAKAFSLMAIRLDQAINVPFSLLNLVRAVDASVGNFPEYQRIVQLVRDLADISYGSSNADERIQRQLALLRVIHQNLYCFSGFSSGFADTFATYGDLLRQLSYVRYLAVEEGHHELALLHLMRLPDAQFAKRYPHSVGKSAARRKAQTELLGRVPHPYYDFSDAIQKLEETESIAELDEVLKAKLQTIREDLSLFAKKFERELSQLLHESTN